MKPATLPELRDLLKNDSGFSSAPYRLIGHPHDSLCGFGTLQEAREWSLLHQNDCLGSVDNSDIAYLKTAFGWLILCIEIHCWPILTNLPMYGVEEVLDIDAAAAQLGGSARKQLREILSNAFPDGANTLIIHDESMDTDFSCLTDAVEYAMHKELPWQSVFFCEIGDDKWLILATTSKLRETQICMVLKRHGFECMSFRSAVATTVTQQGI